MVGITALAATLRLACLGEWSFWVDEAHTFRDATMPLSGDGGFLSSARALYPITFLLLRALIDLGWLAQDEGSLRLPFAVAGITTVPVMALCGRRLVGAGPAVLSALLLAIQPWHVYWSQNARGYVFVVLASVVGVNRLHAWIKHDRMRDLLAVVAMVVIATASHPTGGLLAFGVATFFFLRRQRFDRGWWLRIAVVGIAVVWIVPWIIENWSPFQDFLRQKDDPSLLHFVQTVSYYFRPMVLVAASVGLLLLRQVGGRDRALVLGSLAAVPLVVLLAIGSQLVLATARYAICALPVVTWLAAFSIWQMGKAARWLGDSPWLRAAAASLVPLLFVLEHATGLVDYYGAQHGQRARWRQAAEFLRERAAGRPLRVSTINYPTMLYYLRRGDWSFTVAPEFEQDRVMQLESWMIEKGEDQNLQRVHEPGGANHIEWHKKKARGVNALLAFVVTFPELGQQDRDRSFRRALAEQCELVLYLPCWVGPKDESLFVYVLKEP